MTKQDKKIYKTAKALLDDYAGKGHEPMSDDIDNATSDLMAEYGLDYNTARLYVTDLC